MKPRKITKRGWYICCPECDAEVFVSRWKWIASFDFNALLRQQKAGFFRGFLSRATFTLEWRD